MSSRASVMGRRSYRESLTFYASVLIALLTVSGCAGVDSEVTTPRPLAKVKLPNHRSSLLLLYPFAKEQTMKVNIEGVRGGAFAGWAFIDHQSRQEFKGIVPANYEFKGRLISVEIHNLSEGDLKAIFSAGEDLSFNNGKTAKNGIVWGQIRPNGEKAVGYLDRSDLGQKSTIF